MATSPHLFATMIFLVCAGSFASIFHSGYAQTCGAGIGGSCGNACCSQFGYCGTSCDYCGAGCQGGYGHCGGCNCFPESAMVTTRGGIPKPISALSIGEEVAVRNGNGVVEYDAVYALGHSDPDALSEFIVLTLSSLQDLNVTQMLQLTPRHFTIVHGPKNTLAYKLAANVKVGDRMLAVQNEHDLHFSTFFVSGIEKQMMRGLYKPLTLRGTIVVNNVLASCHSQWYLHSTLERIFGSNALPSIYQAIFSPIKLAYTTLHKDLYKFLYFGFGSHSKNSIIGNLQRGVEVSFKLLTRDFSSPMA